MDQEFINVYIETMSATVDEYVKKDIMNRTQNEIAKRILAKMTTEIDVLKAKVQELEEKLGKKVKKEVNGLDNSF